MDYNNKVKYSQSLNKIPKNNKEGLKRRGLLKRYSEQVIGKLRNTLEKGNNWTRPTTTQEGIIYSTFEECGILDKNGFSRMYKIEADTGDLDILEERIEQYFKRSYDEAELIGIVKEEFHDERITISKLRENENTPTEKPFENVFGSIANLNWRLGKEYRKSYDKDILVEKYLKELHKKNSDYSILIEVPDIGEGEMPTRRVYNNYFENAEGLKKTSGVKEIEEINKDLEHWNEIILSQINFFENGEKEFIKSEAIEKDLNDLKPLFPRLNVEHPAVKNRKRVN